MWQTILSHMARKQEEGRKGRGAQDFHLRFWTAETSESELQAALRKKWDWVISSYENNALWYSLVISNLHQNYSVSKAATVDSVRHCVTEGIKRSAYDRLKLITQAPSEELGQVVRIPARTLARRKTVFKPEESERILRVASVFQKALEVFEDLQKARKWFLNSKRALGGLTPLQFCDTELGAEEAMNLLGRIEHGVFS